MTLHSSPPRKPHYLPVPVELFPNPAAAGIIRSFGRFVDEQQRAWLNLWERAFCLSSRKKEQ